MKNQTSLHQIKIAIIFCLLCSVSKSQILPNFGVSGNYGILSGDTIVNNNPKVYCNGMVGSNGPVPNNIIANGAIYSNGNGSVTQALTDLNSAISFVNTQSGLIISPNLGGQTLSSGVYVIAGNANLQSTLTLTGNSSSKFIFKVSGNFNVINGSKIILNGCLPQNIIWVVQGNTLFEDNIWFYGVYLGVGSVHINLDNHGTWSILTNGQIVLNQPSYFTNDQNFVSINNLVNNSNFAPCLPNPNNCESLPDGALELQTTVGQSLNFTCYWTSPTFATPDYYNAANPSSFSVPGPNFFGYQADHSTGVGYGGVALYNTGTWREYLQSGLKNSLTSGQQYYIEYYWVLTENSQYAVNRLELAFTNGPVSQPITTTLFLTPAIPTTGVLLNDVINWNRIAGCYTANGTENNLIIGTFYNTVRRHKQLNNLTILEHQQLLNNNIKHAA